MKKIGFNKTRLQQHSKANQSINQSINQSSLRLLKKNALLTQTQEGCIIELKTEKLSMLD